MDVAIKCSCGKLQGIAKHVTAKPGHFFTCMCDDCQAFAHYLNKGNEVLDKNGGTAIYTLYPAHLKITQGLENLKCLRLTPGGLIRWYTGCCHSPVCNVTDYKNPYLGTIHTIFDLTSTQLPEEKVLGKIFAIVNSKYGIPPLPELAEKTSMFKVGMKIIKFMLKGKLLGLNSPSPFYETVSHKIAVEPYVLTHDERERLRKFCGPHPQVPS